MVLQQFQILLLSQNNKYRDYISLKVIFVVEEMKFFCQCIRSSALFTLVWIPAYNLMGNSH